MQHTEAYNLNLIETSDTFSPDPLNQNAQLLEDAVEAEAAARTAADSALSQRIQVFEAKRFKYGTYKNTETTKLYVNVGFRPKIVFIQHATSFATRVLFDETGYPTAYYRINNNGFEIDSFTSNHENISQQNALYFFLAFA